MTAVGITSAEASTGDLRQVLEGVAREVMKELLADAVSQIDQHIDARLAALTAQAQPSGGQH